MSKSAEGRSVKWMDILCISVSHGYWLFLFAWNCLFQAPLSLSLYLSPSLVHWAAAGKIRPGLSEFRLNVIPHPTPKKDSACAHPHGDGKQRMWGGWGRKDCGALPHIWSYLFEHEMTTKKYNVWWFLVREMSCTLCDHRHWLIFWQDPEFWSPEARLPVRGDTS